MTTDRTNGAHLSAVRAAGRRYAKARATADVAKAELDQALIKADAAGVPRAHLVEASGVARMTVWAVLPKRGDQ